MPVEVQFFTPPPGPRKKNRQPQAGWYYAYTYFYSKENTAWEFLIFLPVKYIFFSTIFDFLLFSMKKREKE